MKKHPTTITILTVVACFFQHVKTTRDFLAKSEKGKKSWANIALTKRYIATSRVVSVAEPWLDGKCELL